MVRIHGAVWFVLGLIVWAYSSYIESRAPGSNFIVIKILAAGFLLLGIFRLTQKATPPVSHKVRHGPPSKLRSDSTNHPATHRTHTHSPHATHQHIQHKADTHAHVKPHRHIHHHAVQHKRCSFCHHVIPAHAVSCKFCGHRIR